jgi:hypothetical protein
MARVGGISGIAAIEVLIGLSFVFFLLSTVCSAVQETLAAVLGWRAKTLEDAVNNMLGMPREDLLGKSKPKRSLSDWLVRIGLVEKRIVHPDLRRAYTDMGLHPGFADLTTAVFEHWRIQGLVSDPGSELRRRCRPSYVRPQAVSVAIAETVASYAPQAAQPAVAAGSSAAAQGAGGGASGTAQSTPASGTAQPAPWARTDAEIFALIQEALARVPAEHPREMLQKAAANAGGRLEGFRAHVETAFEDSMERATGWYKRKAQFVVALVAIAFAVGLNVDTVRLAATLYNDQAVRSAVVGKGAAIAKPQDAADAVAAVKQLKLPVGWGAANTPSDFVGWLSRIPGWLITIAALNLGAPFWFDLLSRFSRQRQAGLPDRPGRQLSDKPSPDAGDDAEVATPGTDGE